MGVHLSDNPGLSPEIRSYALFKLKAQVAEENQSGITSTLIEQDKGLNTEFKDQIANNQPVANNLAQQARICKEL